MELKHFKNDQDEGVSVLLIVPYGIETSAYGRKPSDRYLLIVPYGIETNLVVSLLLCH